LPIKFDLNDNRSLVSCVLCLGMMMLGSLLVTSMTGLYLNVPKDSGSRMGNN
jgi:hypothetical protein